MSEAEQSAFHLFDVTGVEVEYMIVDKHTLQVKPIADQLIEAVHGKITGEFEREAMAWSNELTLHLIEFKTNGPRPSLNGLAQDLAAQVITANKALEAFHACLLPTAMHPLMDPATQMKLWPHDYDVVYAAFDRIFDCRGHGWANLQSVHINLPFVGDEEFGRLHAAIRVVLPLLPALAASSPLVESRWAGYADARLHHYRGNAHRVPSVSGLVIPERVFTHAAYESQLLGGIYRDLAALDPEGILRHEWVNSRGAIARFDRGAIEIRLLDVQESPLADTAVVALVTAVVKALVQERWTPWAEQQTLDESALAAVLDATIRDGDAALIALPALLQSFGLPPAPVSAREVWLHLMSSLAPQDTDAPQWQRWYDLYARQGCLSARIARAVGSEAQPERLLDVYGQLAQRLASNELFSATDL